MPSVHSHNLRRTTACTRKRQHPARLDQIQNLATICPAIPLPGISRKQVVYVGITEFFFPFTCRIKQTSRDEGAVGRIYVETYMRAEITVCHVDISFAATGLPLCCRVR